MKALTIWQPWASLIVYGVKPYEFRGWKAPGSIVGQRIAIHAGARPVVKKEIDDLISRLEGPNAWTTCLKPDALDVLRKARANADLLPRTSILGTVILGESILASEIVEEFGGKLNDSDRMDHCNYAWPMREIERFTPPVEAKGAQGFWEWNP